MGFSRKEEEEKEEWGGGDGVEELLSAVGGGGVMGVGNPMKNGVRVVSWFKLFISFWRVVMDESCSFAPQGSSGIFWDFFGIFLGFSGGFIYQ